jgi:hypothetical protein
MRTITTYRKSGRLFILREIGMLRQSLQYYPECDRRAAMTLRYFYRIAAACFLTTIAVLTALNIALAVVGREGMGWLDNLPFLVRLPLGLLGVAGAIGIVSLWFGMMWDCLFVSRLSLFSKIGWFLLLLITNMLGTLIYYYVRFQRREPATT